MKLLPKTPQQTIEHLRSQLHAAQDQIQAMNEALLDEIDWHFVPGLGTKERLMLSFIVRKRRASKKAIYDYIYSAHPNDPPDIKIIDVWAHRIRKKLPPGCELRTLWGVGFLMPDETIRILKGMQARADEAVV